MIFRKAFNQNLTKARGLLVSSHTSPNSLHDCMTPSETFRPESFSHSFFCFQASGRFDRREAFSDLQKRQDFEGRTPRRHKTVGFGTCGSYNHPFQTKFPAAFSKLDHQPQGGTINTVFCACLTNAKGNAGLVSYLSKSAA